jgi:hypothetical protein
MEFAVIAPVFLFVQFTVRQVVSRSVSIELLRLCAASGLMLHAKMMKQFGCIIVACVAH